jgi:DNA transformation protein
MDNDAIADMFSGLGPVSIRRMFGGKGVYHNGLIVAVEVSGQILLKGDDVSAPEFAAAGAEQWGYGSAKSKKPVMMPYWTIPDSAIDDPDELTLWTRKAYEAAVRAKAR